VANIPEYTSGVPADSFQVRTITPSSEPEQLFAAANAAGNVAQRFGDMYQQEMVQRSREAGAAAMIYEQQPDGTQRLRPLQDLQAIDFGAGNQAYNQALLQQYSAAVMTDVRQAYGRFQTQHANSPGEFNAAVRGYNQTLLDSMPANARGTINLQLQQMASQFSGAIAERQQRVAQEQLYSTAVRAAADMVDDGDRRSQSNPNDPELPLIRGRILSHLENMRITHGDRVNDVTIRDTLRGYDLTIEGNRVSQQAMQIYQRAGGGAAGRVAAQRFIDQYRHPPSPDTPNAPGGVWRPPQQSLIEPPTPEDRQRAREIAGSGALRAAPGARLNEAGRPILRNPDGSVSTERSITVEDPRLNGGRVTLIPSIQEGQQLSPRQAIAYAIRSGQRYPSFDNQAQADEYAVQRSHGLGQGQVTAPLGSSAAAAAAPPPLGAPPVWTTRDRDQIAARANAFIGDQENRRTTAESERRQHDADVTQRALVEANIRRQYVAPDATLAQSRIAGDVIARFGPQLSGQGARDALTAQLTSPVSAEIWRQQTERERGRDTIQLVTALDANRAAAADGRPFPYPLTQVTQAFPPHMWGAAAAQIQEQQNAVTAAQATLLRNRNTVNTAMEQPTSTVPVPQATGQAVYDQSYVNPQTGVRSAPPLTVPAARQAPVPWRGPPGSSRPRCATSSRPAPPSTRACRRRWMPTTSSASSSATSARAPRWKA
jgi:hypothetical protein